MKEKRKSESSLSFNNKINNFNHTGIDTSAQLINNKTGIMWNPLCNLKRRLRSYMFHSL